ncbi:uncharacterized protein M6G45_014399 isoform 2-T2 [Spheniscus humboldti]
MCRLSLPQCHSGRDCCQLASDSCPGRAPWVPKLAARCRHGASLGAAGAAAGSGNNPLMPGAVSARFLEAAEGRPANCRPEPGGEDAAGAGEGAEAGRESLVVPEGCKGPQRQSGTGMVTEEMPPPAGSAAMVGVWGIFSGAPEESVPQSLEQDAAQACQQGPDGAPEPPSAGTHCTPAHGEAVRTARGIPAPTKLWMEELG